MTRMIRAHFDGKVIVPDEPAEAADLPVNTPLTVSVEVDPAVRYAPKTTAQERQAKWEAFLKRIRSQPVPHLPDDALGSESIYEDD